MHYDVIIVGAGAAGLMCAATAGGRGRSVQVIDHANKAGKKILMSGGGRCNFTNMDVTPDNYLSHNPHFCKSALSRYNQWQFLELVNQYQIAWHDKGEGELFCDNKASDILNMLLSECENNGVRISLKCSIEKIEKTDEGFSLHTSQGRLTCESLVIATGGLSIPTMGATGFGYQVAEQFQLAVTERRASLVPFTFSGRWQAVFAALSGVSLRATVSCPARSFTGDILFTHRGLSGPAILQLSNYWQMGEAITLNLLPNLDLPESIVSWQQQHPKQELKTLLAGQLPKRFVQAWLETGDALPRGNIPVNQLQSKEVKALTEHFQQCTLTPSGTEGYRTAEVTRGGVDTDGISSKTFEAKTVQGLYFVGEVLDVTGWLGGFNFQWAWASGWCAGQYV